jgi:LPS O-antigen subunit length determinant protein (WzzB/FepE family)
LVDNEQLDLIEIFHKLWNNKFSIMFYTIIPALIAMIVSLLIPKRYTSETAFLAPEVAAGGGIIQTPFGGFSSSGLGQGSLTSQAVIALLQSDVTIKEFIEQFNIMDYYGFKIERDAIEFVKEKMTSIEFVADEGIIKLSVETYSPEISKTMVEFYINNLKKLNEEFKLTTESPILKIISPPYLPEKKSFPKTKTNIAIAGLGGLICGLLFIYLKEQTINTR